VCLSRHEGFGLAAIEALSAGLIPILSDIPPFRSLVVRSGLGVLAPPGAEDAVTTWLLASRKDDAAAWSAQRARAIDFADAYDWQQVAGRYLQVYDELEKRS